MFVLLMIILQVYIWLTAQPSDYKSGFDYFVALVGPLVMAMGSLLFIYSWSDIVLDDEGLIVEFLWFNLRVFWRDIIDLKHIGSKSFGVWLLRTNNKLTFLHRLYGLFYMLSIHPSLPIHTQSKAHNELIREINRHLPKR